VTSGKMDLMKLQPTSLPINPKAIINGVVAEKCSVFKSAMAPMKLTFNLTSDSAKALQKQVASVIYKHGDDLRQDQLILQIISLMDSLLKEVNLDLEFTPYRVLATSKETGFVEFVPDSSTIQDILKEYKDNIHTFISKQTNPQQRITASSTPSLTLDQLLQTFINSCAGYCAATYILGIGDRHLENLLIDITGHLFHIDFGFILGKNPTGKNLAPPIRICKEMVECMGGNESTGYQQFKHKCKDAFIYLRDHSKYILNLFYIMKDAGIKDLSGNSEASLAKLHEKFMPNKSQQEAEKQFLKIIEESVNAFFPKVMEKIHVWALYWK